MRREMDIHKILARRTDLSTFLVHLTRSNQSSTARQNLENIIRTRKLIASSAFGHASAALKKAKVPAASQRCVCFTETPLEHVSLLTEQIDNRQFKFEPYGVAVTKKYARRNNANPVWYVDITPGTTWLSDSINALVDSAIKAGTFDTSDIAMLTPFIEQMGTGETYRKEFWWEREWRCRGDFPLPLVVIAFCPEDEIPEFDKQAEQSRLTAKFVDPSWNLERIIGCLAGLDSNDLGSF
jgi:hypothetical protein